MPFRLLLVRGVRIAANFESQFCTVPDQINHVCNKAKNVLAEVVRKRQIKSARGGNASRNTAGKVALISQGHAGNRCVSTVHSAVKK